MVITNVTYDTFGWSFESALTVLEIGEFDSFKAAQQEQAAVQVTLLIPYYVLARLFY